MGSDGPPGVAGGSGAGGTGSPPGAGGGVVCGPGAGGVIGGVVGWSGSILYSLTLVFGLAI